ncbi:MAG: IPT/TIG domain-containing protein [Thermoanaerobaculia bacterium]
MRPLLRTVCALLALGLSAALSAATFTVNSNADTDDGVCNAANCTLREAINAANASAGLDTIRFQIGSGAKTIQPLSALPTIVDPVTIDGTTQPGFSGTPLIELDGSSAGQGSNGLRIAGGGSLVTGLAINRFVAAFPASGGNGILIETAGGNEIRGCYIGTNLSGNAALGNGGDGVQISSSSSNLVGRISAGQRINVISGNANYGVRVMGAGANMNTIAGDRIGTNAAGTLALPNGSSGVAILTGTGNTIGSAIAGDTLISGSGDGVALSGTSSGTVVTGCWIGLNAAGTAAVPNVGQGVNVGGSNGNTIGPANVISGNAMSGVLLITGSTGNTVTGNFIGTNAAGTAAVGNLFNGVIASGADANTIGPINLISGNGTNGVRLRSGAANNVVKGNLVGVNAAVTAALPNAAEGVQINDGATGNTVGGLGTDRNVVSGNTGNGVLLLDATTQNNVVQGNFIGTNATASAPIPNGGSGVDVQGAGGNMIGGTAAGTKNLISFNAGRGVFVESGTGNAILGNTISFNASLGIDLAPAGVTPNDPGDADTGANMLQNFPVLGSVVLDAAATQVQGSLNSVPNATYRLEFFASLVCDPSGYGQGQRFLGTVDRATDAGGNVAFVAVLGSAALGPWVTATATDAASNTSEFSACVPVPGPTVTAITPTSGPSSGGTPVAIAGSNFQSGATVKIGGAAATLVSVVSGVEVDASTPALSPGTLNDVVVTNPSSLAASLAAAFLADFNDVPGSNLFHDDVEKVFRAGITAGCGNGNFCVSAGVTRAQMAVFLLKAEHGSAYVPPACTGVFADVVCPSAFADWIERLAAEGITAGCGGGNYCPANPVRRDQMAVFLLKTEHGSAYTPPTCTGVFGDVVCPGAFTDWIEQLYAENITGGCQTSPLLYCPTSPSKRGQMAVFLVKTFGL